MDVVEWVQYGLCGCECALIIDICNLPRDWGAWAGKSVVSRIFAAVFGGVFGGVVSAGLHFGPPCAFGRAGRFLLLIREGAVMGKQKWGGRGKTCK